LGCFVLGLYFIANSSLDVFYLLIDVLLLLSLSCPLERALEVEKPFRDVPNFPSLLCCSYSGNVVV